MTDAEPSRGELEAQLAVVKAERDAATARVAQMEQAFIIDLHGQLTGVRTQRDAAEYRAKRAETEIERLRGEIPAAAERGWDAGARSADLEAAHANRHSLFTMREACALAARDAVRHSQQTTDQCRDEVAAAVRAVSLPIRESNGMREQSLEAFTKMKVERDEALKQVQVETARAERAEGKRDIVTLSRDRWRKAATELEARKLLNQLIRRLSPKVADGWESGQLVLGEIAERIKKELTDAATAEAVVLRQWVQDASRNIDGFKLREAARAALAIPGPSESMLEELKHLRKQVEEIYRVLTGNHDYPMLSLTVEVSKLVQLNARLVGALHAVTAWARREQTHDGDLVGPNEKELLNLAEAVIADATGGRS